MSIGPLLNVDQFSKFITVIKSLSARVETEHFQRLSELKRLEESSGGRAGGMNGAAGASGLGVVNPAVAGVSDFEALVRGTTNGTTNGLGARGKQVDIFSDESPVSLLSSFEIFRFSS
jgi:SCY1-like protein 2